MRLNGPKRLLCMVLVAATAAAGLLPVFGGRAFAYGQVTSRKIQLSDSVAGDTNVTYQVGFTTATTGAVQGVVVDFCSNDPIIGDACTAPTGFTVGTPTVATSGGSNTGLSGTWTAASANSGRTLELTNASGGSITSGTPVIFTLSTATNPTAANTTFYARVFTFATTAAVTTWAGTANGSSTTGVVDAGGFALSTAASITVTAKVQEQLSFCLYTGANCAAGGSAVTLGNANGVLSSSGPYVDKNTKYDISTNASSGAAVNLKGATLTSGSNTIAAIGATAASSAPGTAQFGLCTYESSGTALTFSNATYNNANCSSTTQTAGTGSTGGAGTAQFGFNTTNTTSTFGDSIATAAAGNTSTGTVAMIANIPVSQVAGVYTSTLTFIANGTF